MSSSVAIDRAEIAATETLIRPYIRQTPVIEAAPQDLGIEAGFTLTLKLEFLQHTGSFKPRGAFSGLLHQPVPAAGVAAASGGNHGAAVAFAAQRLGVPAAIFVPSVAAPSKLARIRAYGATLTVAGDRYDDALVACRRHIEQTGARGLHAYDQRETLLGQATVALELEQQCLDVDTVLVAVGGGGLIGGMAAWLRGRVKLVGVEPETAPTLHTALVAGRPVDAPAGGIAADSLAPRQVGALMFPLAQAFVDRVVLVSDEAIADAQTRLWQTFRIAAEPGGATALAALLSGGYHPAPGERVAVLVCGANPGSMAFAV
jgi:threonine dehydratase